MLTQALQTWIATSIVLVIVQAIVLWPIFQKIESDFDIIIFIIQVIAPLLYLGIWLYLII